MVVKVEERMFGGNAVAIRLRRASPNATPACNITCYDGCSQPTLPAIHYDVIHVLNVLILAN